MGRGLAVNVYVVFPGTHGNAVVHFSKPDAMALKRMVRLFDFLWVEDLTERV